MLWFTFTRGTIRNNSLGLAYGKIQWHHKSSNLQRKQKLV